MKIAIIPVSQFSFFQAVAYLEKIKKHNIDLDIDIYISHTDINNNEIKEIKFINSKFKLGKIIDLRKKIKLYKSFYSFKKKYFYPQVYLNRLFSKINRKTYELIFIRNTVDKRALELVILNFIKGKNYLFVDDGGREYFELASNKKYFFKKIFFNFFRSIYLKGYNLPIINYDANNRVSILKNNKHNVRNEIIYLYNKISSNIDLETKNNFKVLYTGTYSFKKKRHSIDYEIKIINQGIKKASDIFGIKIKYFVFKPHPKFFTFRDYNYFSSNLLCKIVEYNDINKSSEILVSKLNKIKFILSHGSSSLVTLSNLFNLEPVFIIPNSTSWPHISNIIQYCKKNHHHSIQID